MCSKFCTDNRKHIWALSPNAAHVVSSGKASVSKTQIALHIWLLPQHELPLPLRRALCIFSTSHSQPSQVPWWESQGGLIPFPKITSTRGKGQGGGAYGPFCKSFKYPGTDPLKKIMKGKQASFLFSH